MGWETTPRSDSVKEAKEMSDFCQDCGEQFEHGDETVTTNLGFICGPCMDLACGEDWRDFEDEERYVE